MEWQRTRWQPQSALARRHQPPIPTAPSGPDGCDHRSAGAGGLRTRNRGLAEAASGGSADAGLVDEALGGEPVLAGARGRPEAPILAAALPCELLDRFAGRGVSVRRRWTRLDDRGGAVRRRWSGLDDRGVVVRRVSVSRVFEGGLFTEIEGTSDIAAPRGKKVRPVVDRWSRAGVPQSQDLGDRWQEPIHGTSDGREATACSSVSCHVYGI